MYPTATELPVRAYDNVNESTKNAQQDAMLNPRFYTTDFAKIDAVYRVPGVVGDGGVQRLHFVRRNQEAH